MKIELQIPNASGSQDRTSVEKILNTVAAEFGMIDNTVTSRVPDTIRCYVERIGGGFAMGARVVGDLVIVDFNAGNEESPKFLALKEQMTSELNKNFSLKISLPSESDYIPAKSTLPLSAEAEDLNRKRFERL